MKTRMSPWKTHIREFVRDFYIFVYKQAYACIFGFALVFMIVVTKYYYPFEGILYRYDFLFLFSILFQAFLIITKLESWQEVRVIAVFHMVAMGMEIFKTHPSIGSWQYPETFRLGIMYVPFFAGFMYSAVGSYIARVWRIFEFRYDRYPKKITTILIACAIYINFFTHHFIWDFRSVIILWVFISFWRTTVYFKPFEKYYSMNLAGGFLLVSIVIWIGENIATYSRIWVYPFQTTTWHMVGSEKITAWFLLIIISFVLVSLIHRPKSYSGSLSE